MATNRNPVFDIMKGIGIILMLIGHVPLCFHTIYSFHMPLFFIVAGVFAHPICKEDIRCTIQKDFCRLIIPVIVTMAFIILLSPLHYITDNNFHYSIAQCLSLLWAGDALETIYGHISIDSMWFLMALFWVKWYFRGILYLTHVIPRWHDEIVLLLCGLLSFASVVIHRYVGALPWGILLAGSALIFYAAGWYFYRHKPQWPLIIISICCWGLALKYGGIIMVSYSYKCYIIDILGAIGATYLIYLLSSYVSTHTKFTSQLLQWFGINSMLILCINTLDRKSYLVRAIKGVLGISLSDGYLNVAFHYCIEFILIIIVLYIPMLAQVYKAKKLSEI